jgi:DNA-binding NtrC family response regulator
MSPIAVLAELEQECVRSRTFGRPLSVMVVRPLRRGSISSAQLSARCVSAMRASDRAGLYDRGSLLLLLPETDAQGAQRVAAQLVQHGSVVCGIASIASDRATREQLLRAAFSALDATDEQTPIAVASDARAVREVSAEPLVRRSPSMLELAHMIERLAPRRISVLVLGETGTGKELVARELHEKSERKDGPLQIVNCGAIPEQLTASVLFGHVRGAFTGAMRDQEGVFAQADGGTIFLDEVGELSAEAQTMLLRVLDTQRICPIGGKREQTVNVRVIAATHRNLAAMAEQGAFRLDLYHRLNSVVLRIPPLRDRRQEIVPLAQHFLERFQPSGPSFSLSDEVCTRLMAYSWPGNVRELRNVIERAVALCESAVIREEDLPHHLVLGDHPPPMAAEPAPPPPSAEEPEPAPVDGSLGLRRALREQEIKIIEAALQSTDGNQRRAADLLQIPLRTFERKLRILGIRRPR